MAVTSLPLHTDRLTLRTMTAADAEALAAYRNDENIARYQEWDLPFTLDDATRFVSTLGELSWPVLGDWYQLAIEHRGTMVGDVGVGRSDDGLQASIGYTLAPAHHGSGFATEAVAAVIDALFAEGVHRVSASVDPVNMPSAAVLERVGFRFEGRDLKSVHVHGEWHDDDRYALLAEDRTAWTSRPRNRPEDVRLSEITAENGRAVGRLATHHTQESFVAPVVYSYRDALLPDVDDNGGAVVPWFRAIEADGEPVGFVMLAEATDTSPDPYLWRLLVDRFHQGRGIGGRVVEILADRARAAGHRRLLVSWVPGRGGPEGFYAGLGFVPTGEIDDGEVVAALAL